MNFEVSSGVASRRKVLLVCLFLLALAVRIFRAVQEPVVNPDAIRFIDQARLMPTHLLQALRGEVYHPLHSLAALLVHSGIGAFFHDDRAAWLAAVQSVGVVCGSIVALQIVGLARSFGAPFWASMAAGLAWVLGRRTSAYGADGLSDMLFLCLFAGAMLTAMRAMRFRDSPARQWRQFAVVGVVSGLAYLTRPEAVAAPLIVATTLLIQLLVRHTRQPRRFKLLSHRVPSFSNVRGVLIAMLVGFVLPAAPYMIAIRGFTQKKSFGSATRVLSAQMVQTPSVTAAAKLPMELWETFGFAPVLAVLLAMLIAPYFWGRPRVRLLVVVWIFLWVAVMAALMRRAGYLDGRHTLPLQLVLHGLLALAFLYWTKPMRCWMNFWRRRAAWDRLPGWMQWRRWPYAFAGCAVALVILPGVIRLNQPPLEDQTALRAAADWVASHALPGVVVADRERLVGYYAGHPYRQWLGSPRVPMVDDLDPRQRYLLGYIYRPGLGDVPQLSIRNYRAVISFEALTAAHGDIYVLYAPDNGSVLAVPVAPLTTFPESWIAP